LIYDTPTQSHYTDTRPISIALAL